MRGLLVGERHHLFRRMASKMKDTQGEDMHGKGALLLLDGSYLEATVTKN